MKLLTRTVVPAVLLACSAGAFATESDAAAIEETYNAWVEVTNARDIDSWSTWLAPGALFLPPGELPLETEDAILDYYRASFADPFFSLKCQQISVDLADSGEMAWARGACLFTFTNSLGEKGSAKSRWTKIWLRQADGAWKCRLNTWNIEDE